MTLLKLFSDASTAAKLTAAGEDKASLRREVAFQFVSCGFSIATFIVTAIGLHKVMLAVHTTSVRVSKRVSNAATAFRMRTMATGAVHPTGGQRTAMHLQPTGTHQILDLEQEACPCCDVVSCHASACFLAVRLGRSCFQRAVLWNCMPRF